MTALVKPPTKAQAALSMRMFGASYPDIVETIGFKDEQAARAAVNQLLAQDVPVNERKHHRKLIHQRLEALLDSVWDKAHNATHAEQLAAVRAAREILRDMAQLQGAAAPQEIIISNPSTSELLNWMRERGIIEPPAVEEADPYDDIQDAVIVPD